METRGCGANRPQSPSNDIWYLAGHPYYIVCPVTKCQMQRVTFRFRHFLLLRLLPFFVGPGFSFEKFGVRKTVRYRFPKI